VFFLDQTKHRGTYSLPELMAMGRMTTDEAYQARQATLTPYQCQHAVHLGDDRFPKGVMLTHHNIATTVSGSGRTWF
jgi:fatty-acyl-CoA synthase